MAECAGRFRWASLRSVVLVALSRQFESCLETRSLSLAGPWWIVWMPRAGVCAAIEVHLYFVGVDSPGIRSLG
jgi:hypothetical protein